MAESAAICCWLCRQPIMGCRVLPERFVCGQLLCAAAALLLPAGQEVPGGGMTADSWADPVSPPEANSTDLHAFLLQIKLLLV